MINKKILKSRNEKGVTMAILLGAVIILGVLAYIGSTVYISIISGNQRSNLTILSSQALTQAAFILTNETTRNASGIPVASAVATASSDNPYPTNGGVIPTTSAAPKLDSWGTNIGYCVKAASAQSDPVFAVISAGPNKRFDTTCDQALTGVSVSDDKIIVKSVANILQGVGGTVYYGDPVASIAALGSLSAVPAGQIRMVLNDGSAWINLTGAAGSGNWSKIVTASIPTPAIQIRTIGSACAQTNDASGQNALEGIAVTPDRSTVLTCQGGAWQQISANTGAATM